MLRLALLHPNLDLFLEQWTAGHGGEGGATRSGHHSHRGMRCNLKTRGASATGHLWTSGFACLSWYDPPLQALLAMSKVHLPIRSTTI